MSKVLTDQIEKRTGGTAMDVPATGKWPTANIADNAIGASQMADDAVGVAELSATGTASATTYLRGDNAWTAIETGTSWQAVQTASFTAVAGNGYPINTTAATLTMTLPASASVGDTIEVIDYAGTFQTNKVTINPNGLKIQGQAGNLTLTLERVGVRIVYLDATQGWNAVTARSELAISPVFSATGGTKTTNGAYTVHTFTSSANFVVSGSKDVDVMIVAGGGSGGGRHGGGAGGGGVVVKTAHAITTQTYAMVIGAGGSRPSPDSAPGNTGTDSTGFGMTAKGGGGGGNYESPYATHGPGKSGGSGGGGIGNSTNNLGGSTIQQSSGTPTGGTVTAYGYAGGEGGYQSAGDHRQSGGGGGAGAAGESPTDPAPFAGGAGGVGTQIDYDGNNYYWAAGGGGGLWESAGAGNPGGAGGQGGGGGGGSTAANMTGEGPGGAGGTGGMNNGTVGSNAAATPRGGAGGDAGANTGSGGGGGGQGNWNLPPGYEGGGGAGGSGCIIIRYLT